MQIPTSARRTPFGQRDHPARRLSGHVLIAPLMRLNEVVGFLVVRRKEPGLFPRADR